MLSTSLCACSSCNRFGVSICFTDSIHRPFLLGVRPKGGLSVKQKNSSREMSSSEGRERAKWNQVARTFFWASSPDPEEDAERSPSLLPAGKRQARVQLPALFLVVQAEDASSAVQVIGAAIEGGVTGFVVAGSSSGNTSALYEAAMMLKEALRGRAMLLIEDRTDVADAVGADGTILSTSGLPTVVAKNMSKDKSSLIGRITGNASSAAEAAADGANFVVLCRNGSLRMEDVVAARSGQRSGSSIPLLAYVDSRYSKATLKELSSGGIDGFMIPWSSMPEVAISTVNESQSNRIFSEAASNILNMVQREEQDIHSDFNSKTDLLNETAGGLENENAESSMDAEEAVVAQVSQLLDEKREEIVENEKEVLTRLVDYLKSCCPSLEEVTLLEDAVLGLDELFLLVVVGEFNSGKSAVINALLGGQVLAEGVLPTTNEISVVKWADTENKIAESAIKATALGEQTSDGYYIRRVAADFLREVNVVDTPGTNVILDRQQRLTEEFVPRADLVLFVMSADRPLTDSEIRFLKYIRQWGKKVLFVVNKVDLLTSEREVEEVTEFVKLNARRLLGLDSPVVLPVSARLASASKLACRAAVKDDTFGALTRKEQAYLSNDASWKESRFEVLESFIRDFLLGGAEGSKSGERVRLKLSTPLFVANALLEAAESHLVAEKEIAIADLKSISLVRQQLVDYRSEMNKEGRLQREEVVRQVADIANRVGNMIDRILNLSNWNALSSYILGPRDRDGRLPVAVQFQIEVPRDSLAPITDLVQEHAAWIVTNCKRQEENYLMFARESAKRFGSTNGMHEKDSDDEAILSEEVRRRWRESRESMMLKDALSHPSSIDEIGDGVLEERRQRGLALSAVKSFDLSRTELTLEQDVRDAVLGAASTAAGAAGIGTILTTILPNTVEDLMALVLAGAIGYASVLNVPLKRADVKRKIDAETTEIANKIAQAMKLELDEAVDECERRVLEAIDPLEELAAAEVRRIEQALAMHRRYVEETAELQRQVSNVE